MTHDPESMADEIGPDMFVRIQTDLLVIGDSIITDRHHASNGNYKPNDPQNQIGGIVPAFSLSGWLRHGIEKVIQKHGGTACHPGEPNANFRKDDIYNRDLEAGYHEKGACLEKTTNGCVVLDLFGGFEHRPGKLLRQPIQFSPVRARVDYTRGQAEGHYRRLNRNVVSRNTGDNREPLRNVEVDAVANLDGTWKLSFRESKPEFVAVIAEAIEYLDAHQADFMHQLGGARNFGGGIVDCTLVPPLYDETELRQVFDRGKAKTEAMARKDTQWAEEYRPAFQEVLTERVIEV